MYRIGLAIAASVTLVGTALAADIPVALPMGRAPAAVPATAYNWTGVYIGANGGYGWGEAQATVLGITDSVRIKGPFVGGQVGANWQIGVLVLGVEVDGQWADIKDAQTVLGITFAERIAAFGTGRLRAGFAANNFLLYATGGASYSHFELSITAPGIALVGSDTRFGWTAGGGVEIGLGQWSLKGEYLYLRSNDKTDVILGVPVTTRWDSHLARIGINYRFPAGPVQTLY